MAEAKTATQLNEQHEAIEKMAQNVDFGLMAHIMELLRHRQYYARDYIEHAERWGDSGAVGSAAIVEIIESINEKINEALLTKI